MKPGWGNPNQETMKQASYLQNSIFIRNIFLYKNEHALHLFF